LNRKEVHKCPSDKKSEAPIIIGGPRGPTGPTGPTGGTGPTGSIASSFISYFSGQTQDIPNSTSVLLAYTTQQTTNSTITPSASGSAPIGTVDTFTVSVYGYFLITWNVTISMENNGIALVNLLINGTPINPPFQFQEFTTGTEGGVSIPVSGSFLTNVNLDQTIQIQVTSNSGDITADSPSISIIKIADIYYG
jgi:hypothetical protein